MHVRLLSRHRIKRGYQVYIHHIAGIVFGIVRLQLAHLDINRGKYPNKFTIVTKSGDTAFSCTKEIMPAETQTI